jgi:TPR repeat protein
MASSLFQSHRQAEALPWLSASADRGEPRALYILGIATYNGEFVPKDPVRAYALMTCAAGTGLAPAATSLASMNATMLLNQRQMGAALAEDMERRRPTRAREMSAADLAASLSRRARPERRRRRPCRRSSAPPLPPPRRDRLVPMGP